MLALNSAQDGISLVASTHSQEIIRTAYGSKLSHSNLTLQSQNYLMVELTLT